jgi:hypothetical protein
MGHRQNILQLFHEHRINFCSGRINCTLRFTGKRSFTGCSSQAPDLINVIGQGKESAWMRPSIGRENEPLKSGDYHQQKYLYRQKYRPKDARSMPLNFWGILVVFTRREGLATFLFFGV